MLDLHLIREQTEVVRQALLKRMDSVDFSELLQLDSEHRELIKSVEEKKSRRNTVSAEIPKLKKAGQDVAALLGEMKELSTEIKTLDDKRRELSEKIEDILVAFPNIPDEDVLAGGKENNKVLKTYGEKPQFSFPPKDHVTLAEELGLIDYERGAKIGGSGFWAYTNQGARLEWALLNFFIQEHLNDGFEFILPPHLLNWECGYTAGQFPKFAEDVFHIKSDEGEEKQHHFLLPTAETALANFHRDEIIPAEQLPKLYFGYTPCYRKEAGSYRASERGMIRGHQFNKVELFVYCMPDESNDLLERLIQKAESLVQKLGLHYQLSKLAAKDCSAGMAKTYDIEIWIPSMDEYKEISSASNARDYQARRGKIRTKHPETGKNILVHTLNASGLATSRLFPAILEQFQQEDGSVIVPEPLRQWVGADRLAKR